MERLATILRSLPVMLDETRLAKDQKLIGPISYALANGKAKGRGNKTGIDVQESWELNAISTGEASLVSFQEHAGMRARIVTLRGSPFPARDEYWRVRLQAWEELANGNYGHFGPAFVQQVIDHYADLPVWRSRINALKAELSPIFAQNSVAGRHLDYLALVTLTAELCCDWFDLPNHLRCPAVGVRDLLLVEYGEADRPKEAIERLLDFVHGNEQLFLGNSRSMPSGDGASDRPPQPSPYIGRWVALDGDQVPASLSLAIFGEKFTELVKQFGFSSDELLTAWKERGWLHLGERSRPLRNVRINPTDTYGSGNRQRKIVRCVCVKAEIIEQVQAARQAESSGSVFPGGNTAGTAQDSARQ